MNGERIHVLTACHVDQNCCPQVFVVTTSDENKKVAITDDFGNEVRMSTSQWDALVSKGSQTPLPR